MGKSCKHDDCVVFTKVSDAVVLVVTRLPYFIAVQKVCHLRDEIGWIPAVSQLLSHDCPELGHNLPECLNFARLLLE